ncbi:hypothetical protein Dimus_028398 [Dionaea muscipula]
MMDSHDMEEEGKDSFCMDMESLLAHMKYKNAELERKREWLMGFDSSLSFMDKEMRSALSLPESMLRDDDLFSDIAKRHVDKCLEAGFDDVRGSASHYEDDEAFGRSTILSTIFATLDNLSNNGLYLLAKFITGSAVQFEKTRWEMKKVVKNYLSKTHGNQCSGFNEVEILRHLCHLMKDPQTLLQNPITNASPTLQSHRAAIIKILDGLDNMSSHTLAAMLRKLTDARQGNGKGKANKDAPPSHGGKSEHAFLLKTTKWRKQRLIADVNKSCLAMLSQLGNSDELQEPLTKAMAIPGLFSMLDSRCLNPFHVGFRNFPPEIEALQNEIVMAVRLLENVEKAELMKLKAILHPEAKLPDKGLKAALKNVLIDFLFECSDMDPIPDSLFDALAVINRDSRSSRHRHRFFSRDTIKEDMESIFCVSAEMKQMLWDCMPDCEVDQEFANAYMEDLEESDDGDFFNDDIQELDANIRSGTLIDIEDSMEKVESSGDPVTDHFNSPAPMNRTNASRLHHAGGKLEPEHMDLVDREQPGDSYSDIICRKMEHKSDTKTACRNRYLAIQEVCDDASLVSYQVVGHILNKFAEMGNIAKGRDSKKTGSRLTTMPASQ